MKARGNRGLCRETGIRRQITVAGEEIRETTQRNQSLMILLSADADLVCRELRGCLGNIQYASPLAGIPVTDSAML
jgi:hypothetical protein